NGTTAPKKSNTGYVIAADIKDLVDLDKSNEKLWLECKEAAVDGHRKFVEKVEENFQCPCCMEVVHDPVITPCNHNSCMSCLKRSFKAKTFACPTCRYDLGESFAMVVNEQLKNAL